MSILPDVLTSNLKVVFCGKAAGFMSADVNAYYAHPNNRFWKVLFAIALTPKRLRPEEYAQVLTYGIGLTDLVKEQAGGNDYLDLSSVDKDTVREELRGKIIRYRPSFLAFTDQGAAAIFLSRPVRRLYFGLQPETVGQTAIFVLPSTSGLNGAWDAYNHEAYWRELAELVTDAKDSHS